MCVWGEVSSFNCESVPKKLVASFFTAPECRHTLDIDMAAFVQRLMEKSCQILSLGKSLKWSFVQIQASGQ